MDKHGGGKRIIGGGNKNRFWGGILWYVFPSPEFDPLCRSLSELFNFRRENLRDFCVSFRPRKYTILFEIITF